MGCSHAASVWPAGESTEWVADEEAEELAGQDEDEGIKLTAFNMAEERADGYFDEVHVAWKLTPGWCCKVKGKQPQGCREGQVAQYHAVAALRCAVRLIASFAEEHSCPDSAADATPAPACRAATTSRTRRMMKRRRTPGWPPGKEVRRPEHNLEVCGILRSALQGLTSEGVAGLSFALPWIQLHQGASLHWVNRVNFAVPKAGLPPTPAGAVVSNTVRQRVEEQHRKMAAAEEAPEMTLRQECELKGTVAAILQPGETVTAALKRLGGQRQQRTRGAWPGTSVLPVHISQCTGRQHQLHRLAASASQPAEACGNSKPQGPATSSGLEVQPACQTASRRPTLLSHPPP